MKKRTGKLISLISAGLITAAAVGIFPSSADNETVNRVMYGTPEIDGVLDDEYRLSAVVHTIEYAENGKLSLGMPNLSLKKKMAFIRNGIIANSNSTQLLASGDYSIDAFPKADVYFLWDSDALYVFAQVFDNDIQSLSESTVSSIYGDIPWLTDSMTHIIYPCENPYAPIYTYVLAGGNACWDHVGAGNDYYAKGGWTTLGDFTTQTAEQRKDDAKNAGSVINVSEGYYTIELRIPLSDAEFDGAPIRESFLQNGNTFKYNFYITDGENGMQANGYHGNNQVIYISNTESGAVLTLSGKPEKETSADTSYETEPKTSFETGQETESVTDVTDTHTSVPTEPLTDIPVTDSDTAAEPPHTAPDDTDTPPQTDDLNPIIYGDVTGDGRVNAADLVRLMKYISGADVEINPITADVNGDGSINSKDLTRLMKLISNDFKD